MRILLSTVFLIGLIFCACSNNPVAVNPPFSFDDATGQPMKIAINQVYSITNPSTTISISIPESGEYDLAVFNSTGRKIRVLSEGQALPGELVIDWDGRNESGKTIKSGIYVFRIHLVGATQVVTQYSPIYLVVPTE